MSVKCYILVAKSENIVHFCSDVNIPPWLLPLKTSNNLDYLRNALEGEIPFQLDFPWNCLLVLFSGTWVVQ